MYINLCTAIYECESSGGAEWILEDTIYLKNIEIQPQIPPMDLSAYNESSRVKDRISQFSQHFEETSGIQYLLILESSLKYYANILLKIVAPSSLGVLCIF